MSTTLDQTEREKIPHQPVDIQLVHLPAYHAEAVALTFLTANRGVSDCGRSHAFNADDAREIARRLLDIAETIDARSKKTIFLPSGTTKKRSAR